MNAATHDGSGVFRPAQVTINHRHDCLPIRGVDVSAEGVVFSCSQPLVPFSEVQVQLQWERGCGFHSVCCRGVVVACEGSKFRKEYRVAIAFLTVTAQPGRQAPADRTARAEPPLTAQSVEAGRVPGREPS